MDFSAYFMYSYSQKTVQFGVTAKDWIQSRAMRVMRLLLIFFGLASVWFARPRPPRVCVFNSFFFFFNPAPIALFMGHEQCNQTYEQYPKLKQ